MNKSFNHLNAELTSPLVLHVPMFSHPFSVETDASEVVVRPVLSEREDDREVHQKSYASHMMNLSEPIYVT